MFKCLLIAVLALVCDAANLKHDRYRREEGDCPDKDCKSKPMEISFVVDGSASIWPGNFTFGLNFIENFVDEFEISPTAVRVSLVTYGEQANVMDAFGFSAHTTNAKLKLAISTVPYRGGQKTNTADGLRFMLNSQMSEARNGGRRVAVVLTDGQSQETAETKQAADAVRGAGLEVFAIGVGPKVSQLELLNIASDASHVFNVDAYNMLEHIAKRLAYEACDRAPKPICSMDPVDLSFVIDSSRSIGAGNFSVGMQFVKDFVSRFVGDFQINPSVVRVSAVTYGDVVNTQDAFDFDSFDTKHGILSALNGIKWRHGKTTNTGAGIGYMRDNQMVKARSHAAHVAIVITDGKSQRQRETASQARRAQEAGIKMFAVGVGIVGVTLDAQELNIIAGDPSRVLTADNYAQLNLLKERLTNLTCTGIAAQRQEMATQHRGYA